MDAEFLHSAIPVKLGVLGSKVLVNLSDDQTVCKYIKLRFEEGLKFQLSLYLQFISKLKLLVQIKG